jgi:hypothetical protein
MNFSFNRKFVLIMAYQESSTSISHSKILHVEKTTIFLKSPPAVTNEKNFNDQLSISKTQSEDFLLIHVTIKKSNKPKIVTQYRSTVLSFD